MFEKEKREKIHVKKSETKPSKLVLKITSGTWENASRDRRELNVVKKMGADVLVLAKGEVNGKWEDALGIPVFRMSTKPLGKYVPKALNRAVAIITWAYQAAKFKADIISGHDLMPLFIGWISSLMISPKRRPKLIYDSHEFTIYDGNMSWFKRLFIKKLEGFLIKKCSFVIEVNDYIADEVQQIHKLLQRPIVVRNIPEGWDIDKSICKQIRIDIMKQYVNGNKSHLIMYHGSIVPERGIEMLIDVLTQNKGICLFILGNGAEQYISDLKAHADRKNVLNRILFHEAVPQHELWKYVGAADIGMITIKDAWKSYYYMLPNKFFENIQAETPVICSDFPAVSALVKKYRIGLVCDPNSLSDISHCIDKLCHDQIFYNSCKKYLKVAKKELCWEKEQIILENAYRRLL